jgi:hypothetical protein
MMTSSDDSPSFDPTNKETYSLNLRDETVIPNQPVNTDDSTEPIPVERKKCETTVPNRVAAEKRLRKWHELLSTVESTYLPSGRVGILGLVSTLFGFVLASLVATSLACVCATLLLPIGEWLSDQTAWAVHMVFNVPIEEGGGAVAGRLLRMPALCCFVGVVFVWALPYLLASAASGLVLGQIAVTGRSRSRLFSGISAGLAAIGSTIAMGRFSFLQEYVEISPQVAAWATPLLSDDANALSTVLSLSWSLDFGSNLAAALIGSAGVALAGLAAAAISACMISESHFCESCRRQMTEHELPHLSFGGVHELKAAIASNESDLSSVIRENVGNQGATTLAQCPKCHRGYVHCHADFKARWIQDEVVTLEENWIVASTPVSADQSIELLKLEQTASKKHEDTAQDSNSLFGICWKEGLNSLTISAAPFRKSISITGENVEVELDVVKSKNGIALFQQNRNEKQLRVFFDKRSGETGGFSVQNHRRQQLMRMDAGQIFVAQRGAAGEYNHGPPKNPRWVKQIAFFSALIIIPALPMLSQQVGAPPKDETLISPLQATGLVVSFCVLLFTLFRLLSMVWRRVATDRFAFARKLVIVKNPREKSERVYLVLKPGKQHELNLTSAPVDYDHLLLMAIAHLIGLPQLRSDCGQDQTTYALYVTKEKKEKGDAAQFQT